MLRVFRNVSGPARSKKRSRRCRSCCIRILFDDQRRTNVRRLLKLAAAVGAVAVVGSLAAPAGAAPPAGYGFDDHAHVVVAGGSDTTYRAMVGVADLWEVSGLGGCPHSTGVGTAQNSCAADLSASNLGNYQG